MKKRQLPEYIEKDIDCYKNYNDLSLYEKIMVCLFNIPYPHALTIDGWSNYRKFLKDYHPIYYIFTEVIFDFILHSVIYPIERLYLNFKYFLLYVFIKKYHIIKTGLKIEYHTNDERIIHGLFNILKDFVEKTKSRMYKITGGEINPYDTNRDLGLRYIEWEIREGSEYQRSNAKEIKELYLWWVDERPKRKDPWDDIELNNHKDLDIKYKEIDELENKYIKEDEEMLIRLIKIRQGLVS